MCTECHNLYKNSKASLCTPLENKTENSSSLKGCAMDDKSYQQIHNMKSKCKFCQEDFKATELKKSSNDRVIMRK